MRRNTMSLTKRVLKQHQFPEDKGYRDELSVSSRSKRNRYLTKLEKVIKIVTDLIDRNRDINEINQANESLRVL